MKTISLSSTASAASVAIEGSPPIKADRPQQLQSVTVYFRGRKMVLMQRPQRRLSLLLCQMLRRSMRNLFGTLSRKLPGATKRILSAGALCAMALASATTAHATATAPVPLPANTLPDGYTVKYGQVGVSTTGNQMNVDIGTNKAIINWNSFSIGSAASVDFHFANATSSSSVLNRVTGNDPSQIMGSLTSNGKVFLINSGGILVGKNAKVDVAGFVASTLNIRNADFLADKLTFHGKTNKSDDSNAGVMIEQDGSIKTTEGGSVYLIGSTVENDGIINSPGGEVLLAAGKSVDLVDTGTPGVKITVKGKQGKITNLGKIMAATGTIGFGAALIDNRGMLNASSVDKAGGRIFLRASKDLTTTETSTINADGTTGGNVVLYADNSADIGGDVSALGNVDGKGGKGGYVDTSGKLTLGVKYVPRVGPGGEWYIDPYNVIIVASGADLDPNVGGVITATSNSSTISASVIETALNAGNNITIATGSSGSENGDITVNAAITKNDGAIATLKLDAARSIIINQAITSNGTSAGLNLELVAGSGGTGSITQSLSTGQITATSVSATATNGITLTNTGNNVGTFAASNGVSGAIDFTNGNTGIMSVGPVTNTGDIILISAGGISTTGQLNSATGPVNLTTTSTQYGITVGSSGIIGHDIALTTTPGSATDIVLNGGLTANATTGEVNLNSGRGIQQGSTVGGISANSMIATAQAGIALQSTLNSFHSLTAINSNSGAISVVANQGGGALSLGPIKQNVPSSGSHDITVQNGGALTFTDELNSGGGDVSLTSTSGSILLQSLLNAGAGTATLNASGGSITASFIVTAGNVVANAGSGITLANASNQITGLAASVSGTGDITVNTNGGALALNNISTHDGNIAITNTANDLHLLGNLSTGTAGNSISLSALTGFLQSGGGISTDQLTAHTGIDMDLDSVSNNIRNFSATAGTGHIHLHNTGTLATVNAMTVGTAKDVTLTTTGNLTVGNQITASTINLTSNGDIAVNGALVASGGSATLHADGQITQTVGISTNLLNAMAGTGITLNNVANAVNSFSATNANTGDIAFTNGNALTLGLINAGVGNVAINTQGTLTSTDAVNATGLNVNAVGDIGLNGANNVRSFTAHSNSGSVELTDTGNLNVGTITTPLGAVHINTTGALTVTSTGITAQNDVSLTTTNGNIAVDGQITAGGSGASLNAAGGSITQSTGSIVATALNAVAGNSITLNNAGNSIAVFSGSSAGGDIALTNGSGQLLTLGAISSGTHNLTVNTNGNLLQTADGITAAALDLTANGGINLNSNNNHVGTFVAANPLGNINIINNGDLVLGAISGASGTVTVTANGGKVTQSGAMTASGANISAASGIALDHAGNNVGVFNALNSTSGDIVFTDAAGTLSLNGTVRNNAAVGSVSVSNTGNIVGSPVFDGGGNVLNGTFANNKVTLTSTTGNVTLGLVTAANLDVNAVAGAITQDQGNKDILTISNTMNAVARNGITINNHTNVTALNHIANFSATNSTSGDITLYNAGAGNKLIAITNNGGNVFVDNTGAMETVNAISVPNGSVTLATHSPLTIGAGGISAGTGIALSAGNSMSATDVLTQNGPLSTTSGQITMTGNSIVVNYVPPVASAPVPPVAPPTVETTINTIINPPKKDPDLPAVTVVPLTTASASSSSSNSSNQSAGGGDGEFGGTKDDGKGGKDGKSEKSSKPVQACT